MRPLAIFLGIGALLLSACGGGGLKGGSLGTSTSTGTSVSITPQGSCANLTCLDELMALTNNCIPSGDCTMAMSAAGIGLCYKNGVKMSVVIASMASMSGTATVKNSSRVCYLLEGSLAASSTYMIKDPSGNLVATLSDSGGSAQGLSITCADGSTGTLDSTCGSEATTLGATAFSATAMSKCPQGTCAP